MTSARYKLQHIIGRLWKNNIYSIETGIDGVELVENVQNKSSCVLVVFAAQGGRRILAGILLWPEKLLC